jgi:hypothetical protein
MRNPRISLARRATVVAAAVAGIVGGEARASDDAQRAAAGFAAGAPVLPGAASLLVPPTSAGSPVPPPAGAAASAPAVVAPAPVEPQRRPEQWSDADVKAAMTQCGQLLAGLDAQFTYQGQVRSGACGTPVPIELSGFGKGVGVTISPPVVVNCATAAAMHKWLKQQVQPLAKGHLGTSIVQVNTMSSYACRNRYGARQAPLSQHAFANAIDVRSFVTAKGQLIDVELHWGPTRQEVAAFEAAKAKKLAEAKAQAAVPQQSAGATAVQPTAATPAAAPVTNSWTTHVSRPGQPGIVVAALAGYRDTASAIAAPAAQAHPSPSPRPVAAHASVLPIRATFPVLPSGASLAADNGMKIVATGRIATLGAPGPQPGEPLDQRAKFLRSVHESGCSVFGTVLGPEANHAHRNHLHVDMAQRRAGSFCQ